MAPVSFTKKTDPCPFVPRPASQSYPSNITFSRLSLDNVEALRLSDKSRVTAAQKEAFFPHLNLTAAAAEDKKKKKRDDEFNPEKYFFLRSGDLTFTADRDKQAGRKSDPSCST